MLEWNLQKIDSVKADFARVKNRENSAKVKCIKAESSKSRI
ncbi:MULTISPECIES: hypothetical protein [unclassified Helicobacter]|nr:MULTISPECIES: hypothetical protein [unclassified Helicobacter]